jgi:magnesium-transporting ATPase (P-type)
MEGPTFRRLSREKMDRDIPNLDVLARSSPENKRILVQHLKRLGETVAATGDGTLTQNKMTVVTGPLSINDSTGGERASSFFDSFRKLSVPFKNLLIQSIAINSTAFEGEENG